MTFKIVMFSLVAMLSIGCGGGDSSSDVENTKDVTNHSSIIKQVIVKRGDTTNSFVTKKCDDRGGIAIYSGIDTNGNGILDDDEKNSTPQVVCNGKDGVDGQDISKETTPKSFSLNGSISGEMYLQSISSKRPRRSIVLNNKIKKTISMMSGGLWLTPTDIMSAIDEDKKQSSRTSKQPIPISIIKPIKVDIKQDNTYIISKIPSGSYSLVYVDKDKGIKIDDIVVKPNETTKQNITKSDIKTNGTVIFKVASLNGIDLKTATIRLNELNNLTTTTNEAIAGFSNLPEGSYSLTISSNGYVSKYKTFKIVAGKTTNLQTIELNSKKGKLVGSVDADVVDDLANIVVYAKSSDGSIYTTLTDTNGNYIFPSLPVGEGYSIIAMAHDFESSKVDNVEIRNSQTSSASKIIISKATSKVGNIAGFARFLDVEDSLNHAGIIVSIEGTDYEAITARDGSFIFNNISSDKYTLNFTDSNHKTKTKEITVVSGATTNLTQIALVAKLGSLKVKVSDGQNPVVNANVKTTNGATFTTDTNGEVTLSNISVGEQLIQVSKDGYGIGNMKVIVVAGKTVDKTSSPITLSRSILSGKVDLLDKENEAGVKVTLNGANIDEAITNEDGNFTIYGIQPGNYQLQFTKDGYDAQVVYISIENGEDILLDYVVELEDSADIVPLLDSKELTINENLATGSYIGKMPILSFGDRDITSITVVGTGSETFSISNDGNITIKDASKLDYETLSRYELRVFATNEAGNSLIVDLIVNVNNIAEIAPTLKDINISIVENQVSGVDILNESILVDSGDTPIKKIVLDGNGSKNFEITNDGELKLKVSGNLDYESRTNYSLTATAYNNFKGNSIDINITITDHQVENLLGVVDTDWKTSGYTKDDLGSQVDKYGNFYRFKYNAGSEDIPNSYYRRYIANVYFYNNNGVLNTDINGTGIISMRTSRQLFNKFIVDKEGNTYVFAYNGGILRTKVYKYTIDGSKSKGFNNDRGFQYLNVPSHSVDMKIIGDYIYLLELNGGYTYIYRFNKNYMNDDEQVFKDYDYDYYQHRNENKQIFIENDNIISKQYPADEKIFVYYKDKLYKLKSYLDSSKNRFSKLSRYDTNGTIDTTFAVDGTLELYPSYEHILINNDGDMFLTGEKGSVKIK